MRGTKGAGLGRRKEAGLYLPGLGPGTIRRDQVAVGVFCQPVFAVRQPSA